MHDHGWEAVHWSTVGDPCATDSQIMQWADTNGYVVLTHDLDFSAILAVTQTHGPSVMQVRTRDVMSDHVGAIIHSVLKDHKEMIEDGALVVVEEWRSRVRILPLRKSP